MTNDLSSDYRRGLIRAAEIVIETAHKRRWLWREDDGYAGVYAAAIRAAVVAEDDHSATESHAAGATSLSSLSVDDPDGKPLSGPEDGATGHGEFFRSGGG